MDKALTKKIGISILLALLSGLQISWADVPPPIPAASPAADMAQFQSWLKNNGQASGGQPTIPPPPVMSSSTPSSLTTVETITTVTKRKRPTRPMPLTYSQSQQAMLNSVPNTSPPNPDADAAFDSMMQQNIPLTPQQIVRLRQKIDESQRAAAIPATVPPKPVSSTLMVNLAPGATPPAIRLAQGYVTSLVFVDSTGSPWPIASYDIGDPKTTNIQWDGKSNVLLVQASSPYGDSDLVIRLMGLPTPITLELVLGQRVVDYRTDIHVAGIGPNAKDLPTGTGLPNSANQVLLNVLDGVAPPGSRQLTVRGGDCLAWLLGDTMFLRTRLTVLSPGWVGRMVSPDGMYSYEMQKSSSVLVSQYGEPIELKIEGF
ncbi:MAG: DotH/IcmK family type IV secretion protein [Gammaproteobacteria bacterium]